MQLSRVLTVGIFILLYLKKGWIFNSNITKLDTRNYSHDSWPSIFLSLQTQTTCCANWKSQNGRPKPGRSNHTSGFGQRPNYRCFARKDPSVVHNCSPRYSVLKVKLNSILQIIATFFSMQVEICDECSQGPKKALDKNFIYQTNTHHILLASNLQVKQHCPFPIL